MSRPIIILVSGKAESGKDTFTTEFEKVADSRHKKTLRIKYGDFVKMVAKTYYGWSGEKDEHGRYLLQWLGTDLGRRNNPDVWVNCVKETVKALQSEYDFVVISDVRFPNEIECWEDTDFFTYTVRITRKNLDGSIYENSLTKEQKGHPSETSLDDWKFNYYVENIELEDMKYVVENILNDIVG